MAVTHRPTDPRRPGMGDHDGGVDPDAAAAPAAAVPPTAAAVSAAMHQHRRIRFADNVSDRAYGCPTCSSLNGSGQLPLASSHSAPP
jgi:hypothetical protein